MNGRTVGMLLGASAALAIAVPGSALAWSGYRQSYDYEYSPPAAYYEAPRYGSTWEDPYAYRPYSGVAEEEYYGSSEPPAPRAYRGDSGEFVAVVDLNMHVAPGDMAPVSTVLPAGTPMRLAGPDVGGWWRVNSPYGIGWVYSRYLDPR